MHNISYIIKELIHQEDLILNVYELNLTLKYTKPNLIELKEEIDKHTQLGICNTLFLVTDRKTRQKN